MRQHRVTESRTCQTHFSLTVRDGLQQCIERDWWTRTTLTPISGRLSPSTNCLKAAPVSDYRRLQYSGSLHSRPTLRHLDWLARHGTESCAGNPVVSVMAMLRQSTLGADEATALVITTHATSRASAPEVCLRPTKTIKSKTKKSSPVSILHLLLRRIGRAAIKL